MQTLFKSYSQLWVNQIQYGFKHVSIRNKTNSRHRYYATKPLQFQKFYQMKKKYDFKNDDLTFPINIPLKQRYVYRPQRQFNKATPQNDYLNTEVMSGNEILLYFEQLDNLRINEILNGLERLHKFNKGQFNLAEHPWVKAALDKAFIEHYHLTKAQFIQLLNIYSNYGIETPEVWGKFEERMIKLLPNIPARLFGECVRLFMEKQERSSDEFKKELSLVIPVHLTKMSPQAIAKAFEMVYKYNLMTDYLFYDHLHFILRKRFKWFVMGRACPLMLRLLREANFETCEFLWPEIYKQLETELDRIPNDQCAPIRNELVKIGEAFPSHSQYNNIIIAKKIGARATWEATLGGQARKLSLVEIVKNDILYYKEKQKLQRSQSQQSP
ncbi:unnamed protein product [Paramecium primaurelia]|uniref:Uncharacterized protein n=1 Tax=Paramecium primaurelia TaxID=5886 RepID=A0A8S1LE74_PARPR|nr:unnamed protein product [Paramecium primaurelia]